MQSRSEVKRKKATKRLRVVEALRKSGNRPEWMIFTALPVIPPELRPMVQLDGGRFATSDLNDLYRRVINRNNRLKRLLELGAPDIIVRNEKRMLQEAVDALIDNGRRGRVVSGSGKHKLKSLSDMLKGKQGRFRQNLLGKRVDYSGRSVIVVGPDLALDECGLPKRMALELFKPFVMRRLVDHGHAHNIKAAKRLVERVDPARLGGAGGGHQGLRGAAQPRADPAPARHPGVRGAADRGLGDPDPPAGLHGVQRRLRRRPDGGPRAALAGGAGRGADADALDPQPALAVERRADRLADAGHRARLLLHDQRARLRGRPRRRHACRAAGARSSPRWRRSSSPTTAGAVDLQAEITVRTDRDGGEIKRIETTVGRAIFNLALPTELGKYYNADDGPQAAAAASSPTATGYFKDAERDGAGRQRDQEDRLRVLDPGRHEHRRRRRRDVRAKAEVCCTTPTSEAEQIERQYRRGLVTEDERLRELEVIWNDARDELRASTSRSGLRGQNSVYMMADSGAKGNMNQISQMAGMRGLVLDPEGRDHRHPDPSNFREGLTVLEYFLSTHGARKGLADTALRTADSGYLTRRLVDVAQDVIITMDDCGTEQGLLGRRGSTPTASSSPEDEFRARITGRILPSPVVHPETGEIIARRGRGADRPARSRGWRDSRLRRRGHRRRRREAPRAHGDGLRGDARRLPDVLRPQPGQRQDWSSIGEAVGIIAAQSIGEPGTQLTMRTFHTGGVARADITTGLPRVEELFEARAPKGAALLAESEGVVSIEQTDTGRILAITSTEVEQRVYPLSSKVGKLP